jgi:hypothetical protein
MSPADGLDGSRDDVAERRARDRSRQSFPGVIQKLTDRVESIVCLLDCAAGDLVSLQT